MEVTSMNISRRNAFPTRSGNFFSVKEVLPKQGETFSSIMAAASGTAKTDQYIKSTVSAKSENNVKLKDEDYEYLSGKWNPTQMTQDDYDEFLDYLQDKGIISKEDKEWVGYGGIRRDDIDNVSRYTPYENPVIDYKDGNLLAFIRCQSTYVICDCNGIETESGKYITNLYKKIADILEKM